MEGNSQAWRIFFAAGTQFRWTGGQMSTPSGIDYNAVDIIRRAHRVKSTPGLWDRVALMESEVLRISAANAERAANRGR